MYCPNCGVRVPKRARYCPNCGARLPKPKPAPKPPKVLLMIYVPVWPVG